MTDSDRTLDRKIAHQRKMIALCEAKGHAWTAEIYRRALEASLAQRALPRDRREQYETGSI